MTEPSIDSVLTKADELMDVMRALVESNLALVNALSTAVEEDGPPPVSATSSGMLD